MKKIIIFCAIVLGLAYCHESYAAPVEKTQQVSQKKNKKKLATKGSKAKLVNSPIVLTDDPILRQYKEELNNPDKLTYPDLGNSIATPHTKAEYVDKLVNEMTTELMRPGLDAYRKGDLQKRIQALRNIKKSL